MDRRNVFAVLRLVLPPDMTIISAMGNNGCLPGLFDKLKRCDRSAIVCFVSQIYLLPCSRGCCLLICKAISMHSSLRDAA